MAAMLSAATAERGKRLQTKAQQGRPTAAIDTLLGSGAAAAARLALRVCVTCTRRGTCGVTCCAERACGGADSYGLKV